MASPATGEPLLRVLIVVNSTQRRGAEIEGTELVGHLCALGLDANAVALAPAGGPPQLPISALGRRALSMATLRALRRRARHVDVVIAYGSHTLTACALSLAGTGTPFVYRSIGDPTRWVRGRLHRARWALLYRRATRVVALWPQAAASIHQIYGVPSAHVGVIPNARNPDDFAVPTPQQRRAARSRLGLAERDLALAVVGSLTEEKQVSCAIEALVRIPTAVMLVAGDGPLRDDLRSLAERVAPGRVRFLGRLDDVREVLWASDVLMLTSRTEGMPGVVIEAGMCGVPTVAPPVGALSTMIDQEVSGMVADSAAPDALAEAITRLASVGPSAGAAARSRMEQQYSWSTAAPQWVRLLTAVAAARNHG